MPNGSVSYSFNKHGWKADRFGHWMKNAQNFNASDFDAFALLSGAELYIKRWKDLQPTVMVTRGAFRGGGRFLGSLPKLVKGLAQDSGTQNNHAVKSGTGPTHSRPRQVLLALLHPTFDATRANRESRRAELSVLHPSGVFTEVIRKVVEGIAVKLLEEEVNFAFEEF